MNTLARKTVLLMLPARVNDQGGRDRSCRHGNCVSGIYDKHATYDMKKKSTLSGKANDLKGSGLRTYNNLTFHQGETMDCSWAHPENKVCTLICMSLVYDYITETAVSLLFTGPLFNLTSYSIFLSIRDKSI